MFTPYPQMDLRKILFIGGAVRKLPSVQIRCVDIAKRLGCEYILSLESINDIPRQYRAFVCVKASLKRVDLLKLTKRGVVLWDIIDALPPKEGVQVYLASTRAVQKYFSHRGRIEVIPHHHCNFSGRPNPAKIRRPGWIGSRHWCPKLTGFPFDKYLLERMDQKTVVKSLRRIGIGLNFRAIGQWDDPGHPEKLQFDFHVKMNSGIKLINCFGFGTPSLSGNEPAYHEADEGCTIFCDPAECAYWVKELQMNDHLYGSLRKNCLRRARDFHIDRIAGRYARLFKSL